MADEAVRQEKLKIEHAQYFFASAEKYQNPNSISYKYVWQDEYEKAKTDILAFGERSPIVGVMKLHAVISNGLGIICVQYIMLLSKVLPQQKIPH